MIISGQPSTLKSIGAEFKLVTPEKSSFDDINFEKLFLLDKFANDYDNVLYLDLDVIISTKTNFFEKFNMYTLVSRYEKCSRYDKLGLDFAFISILHNIRTNNLLFCCKLQNMRLLLNSPK